MCSKKKLLGCRMTQQLGTLASLQEDPSTHIVSLTTFYNSNPRDIQCLLLVFEGTVYMWCKTYKQENAHTHVKFFNLNFKDLSKTMWNDDNLVLEYMMPVCDSLCQVPSFKHRSFHFVNALIWKYIIPLSVSVDWCHMPVISVHRRWS